MILCIYSGKDRLKIINIGVILNKLSIVITEYRPAWNLRDCIGPARSSYY